MKDHQQVTEPRQLTVTPLRTGVCDARPWEVARCDPVHPDGCTVILPSPSLPTTRRTWVYVKNATDSTKPIKVVAFMSTIDGQPSIELTAARGLWSFYAVDDRWEQGPNK